MSDLITVNLLEVSSELAHKATIDEMRDLYTEEEMTTEMDGTECYRDDVQDVFNRWYDYFYGEISKYRTKQREDE